MKRVFIVHGWDGFPEEGWFPWLKAELERRGFSVTVPAMPNPQEPRPETWVPHLAEVVGKPDSQTYFVGHSMGCQTILRYAAALSKDAKIGGAVCVAGFNTLTNIDADGEAVRSAWLDVPLDAEKVKKIIPRIGAIFSPTDKWVPLENEKWFKEKLGAQTLVIDGQGEKGHFSGSDGVKQLPEALSMLLEMATPPTIAISDFAKMDIRMGKILKAEKIEGADKLLKLEIDLGGGDMRTICSGIAQFYKPEQLPGLIVPVLANLAPRMMKGVESKGMVLMGIDETGGKHDPVLLLPLKNLPPGSPLS
jgi:uncharacterized protein